MSTLAQLVVWVFTTLDAQTTITGDGNTQQKKKKKKKRKENKKKP
jgi:hypothetical protein